MMSDRFGVRHAPAIVAIAPLGLKQACVDCRIVSGNCAAMSSRQVSAGVVFELFVVA